MSPPRLILASSSPTRSLLLRRAGLSFAVQAPAIDERAVEATLPPGAGGVDVAAALAAAKAMAVSRGDAGALVIGADQTLRIDGTALHKPADADMARQQLLRLAGRSHALHSAVALARDGALLWQHAETVSLAMRPLSADEIDSYLREAGGAATASVGAYQVEGLGIRLFARIDGDFFATLGLPLLPLLARLRQEGALPW